MKKHFSQHFSIVTHLIMPSEGHAQTTDVRNPEKSKSVQTLLSSVSSSFKPSFLRQGASDSINQVNRSDWQKRRQPQMDARLESYGLFVSSRCTDHVTSAARWRLPLPYNRSPHHFVHFLFSFLLRDREQTRQLFRENIFLSAFWHLGILTVFVRHNFCCLPVTGMLHAFFYLSLCVFE